MQQREEFLAKHHNADYIVCDTETGDVIRAEYTRLNGVDRQYPAIYYFPEY